MNIEKAKKLVKGLVFNDDGTMVRYIDFTSEDYDTWGGYTLKEYAEAIETLLTAYEKEKEKNKEAKNLLIDMVNQFAYEDNNPKTRGSSEQKIYTAGLSTLEDAFYLLDIDEGIKREDLWKLKEE